jgi:outer membrane usher protein FimD/PapC
MSASTIAGMHGSAGLASYTFESTKWVFNAFLRHDSPGYAGLADPPMVTNRRYEGSLAASYRLPDHASLSVSHTALSTRTAGPAAAPAQPFIVISLSNRRVDSMTYSRPFPALHAQVTASLSRIRDTTGARLEAFVGLNFLLGRDYSGSAGYTRTDRQTHSESVRLTKNQPMGEGWGFDLSADSTDVNAGSTQVRSNVQYNAPAAVLRAEYGHYLDQGQRTREQRLSVAGGIVAAGGHLAVSRPITQSYAIVKVGEVAEVGVLVDGQPVGKTDSRGMAVIPGLNAYYENTVSIDSGALPMDYSLNAEVKKVAPALRSGTFLDFGATRTQAFIGKLRAGAQGAGKAVEFAEIDLSIEGKLQKLPTGRGGEFYVENLKPGIYPASVNLGAAKCAFELRIPRSDEMFVDLGELYCAAAW